MQYHWPVHSPSGNLVWFSRQVCAKRQQSVFTNRCWNINPFIRRWVGAASETIVRVFQWLWDYRVAPVGLRNNSLEVSPPPLRYVTLGLTSSESCLSICLSSVAEFIETIMSNQELRKSAGRWIGTREDRSNSSGSIEVTWPDSRERPPKSKIYKC